MKFLVTQAKHWDNYSKYGLPTMAITYDGKIVKTKDELDYEDDQDNIMQLFSEIEFENLNDLADFMKTTKTKLVLRVFDKYDEQFFKDNYDYEITIYNDYLE